MPSTTFRRARLERGLSLRALADECKAAGTSVDFGQLGRIERGDSIPGPRIRSVLSEVLGIDVTDFDREAS